MVFIGLLISRPSFSYNTQLIIKQLVFVASISFYEDESTVYTILIMFETHIKNRLFFANQFRYLNYERGEVHPSIQLL